MNRLLTKCMVVVFVATMATYSKANSDFSKQEQNNRGSTTGLPKRLVILTPINFYISLPRF